MSTPTRTITVDGAKVLEGFDLVIRGLQILRAEVARGKTEGAKSIPRLLDDVPAPSRRAEVPKSAAPRGHTTPLPTNLSSGAALVLDAVAQGFSTLDELIVVTGYAGRTIRNLLSELAAHEYITRDQGVSAITTLGLGFKVERGNHSIDNLVRTWSERLADGERKCLHYIRTVWLREGRPATIAELAAHAVLAERTVRNVLSELAKWRLIRRKSGTAVLANILGGPP